MELNFAPNIQIDFGTLNNTSVNRPSEIFKKYFNLKYYLGLVNYVLRFFTALDDRVVTFKEPILDKILKGHNISSKKVPNEGSCRVNCYLNPDCVSINMGPLIEGVLTCELNAATSGNEHTSALESKTGYTYLEIEVQSCTFFLTKLHVFFLLKYCHDLGTKASKNLVTATSRLKKNQSENLQLVRSCVHASQMARM